MDAKTLIIVLLCSVAAAFGITYFSTGRSTADSKVASSQETLIPEETQSAKVYSFKSTGKNKEEKFRFETDLFNVTFDTKGASVSSLMMKEHANADGHNVDLVFRGEKDKNAFLHSWGEELDNPVQDIYAYRIEGNKVIFTNDYTTERGEPFTVVKTFEFKNGEYLFAVNIDIVSDSYKPEGPYDWSIAFEPQVGPAFEKISNNNYDYRRLYADVIDSKGKAKKSTVKIPKGVFYTTKPLKWFGITSKYFSVLAVPGDDGAYKYSAVQGKTETVSQTNPFYVSHPASDSKNTVYFYAGPQLKSYLGRYYSGTDNAWGLRNLDLDDALEGGSLFGWLENILKWCLQMLYVVVPNYGIDIILLTIILKIVLWPLSKKGTDSTAKMSQLQPLVKEVQAKYPDNPQKQNAAMQQLYREYGVSPMGGCLPMLIQFPILIAFYGLLNRHFELRGAMFIPGWIPDLSMADTVAILPFNIPLLGNQLHLLPIIYTVSMIYSMKISQSAQGPASGQQASSMKFMTWGMPIMFFFMLYGAPSGLFLYWTVQNILSIGQQVATNKKMAGVTLKPVNATDGKKEPEAVRKYQEKLKKLEDLKKAQSSNSKGNRK